MMQDDSNSESTFEFVDDKKTDDTLKSGDAFSSLSSSSSLLGLPMMSTDSSLTPSPVFVNSNSNILSAVAPPSALPNFIATQPSSIPTTENVPSTAATAQCTTIAAQPVGLDAALAAAKERICVLRSQPRVGADIPIVAVENYIEEIGPERWYDMSLLLLTHPSLGISLHLSSQGTPLPAQIVTAISQETPPDYKYKDSGFSVTIGSLMEVFPDVK